jgi:hypothetical protein
MTTADLMNEDDVLGQEMWSMTHLHMITVGRFPVPVRVPATRGGMVGGTKNHLMTSIYDFISKCEFEIGKDFAK